jgi:hypothetical protein
MIAGRDQKADGHEPAGSDASVELSHKGSLREAPLPTLRRWLRGATGQLAGQGPARQG